jgi:nucleoside-diphosphate-sugar epimerase
MLIAITGATGFIGSYTVAALAARGHQVRALVRRTSRREHIAASVAEWTVGELHDAQALAGLVAGADVVIHLAADWHALGASPITNFERNLLPSLRLLEAARLAGANQFLFCSSVAVYDQILPGRPLDETHPMLPASIYGAYKAAIEPHLWAYHRLYGMNTSSWRPAGVYGVDPVQSRSQWYKLVQQVKRGDAVDTGRGGKIVHVLDVAAAFAAAVDDAAVAGRAFNLVDCYLYDQQVAEMARELSGSSCTIEDRKGPGPRNTFDTQAAQTFFARHGHRHALKRGEAGVRAYLQELLPRT